MAPTPTSPFSSSESVQAQHSNTEHLLHPATSPLPSPEVPPSSPSNSNRFGLTLGSFIHRRPRGSTNPLSMTGDLTATGGVISPRSPNGNGRASPGEPPSPGGTERERGGGGGYGFPSLRRSISKRQGSASDAPVAVAGGALGGTRGGRRSSQPMMPSTSRPEASSTGLLRAGSGPSESTTGSSSTALPVPFPPMTTSPSPASGSTSTPLPPPSTSGATFRLRLVPHLETSRSLHFEPVDRDLSPHQVLLVGRFTDRSNRAVVPDPLQIAFKSKVVSRTHAEMWCDEAGKFFIKDTKSSSGTFLNHIRLSPPNTESRPFPLKDGDILQLGVDYQGGVEQIYRGVKIRVELNRAWQREMNTFNTNALAQLRALGGGTVADEKKPVDVLPSSSSGKPKPVGVSVNDCCICLYPVTVCQALFIAPCSHVTHFKCIRPLILQNYPGFSCPLCRTYADLEADVEIEDIWQTVVTEKIEEEETDDDNALASMEGVEPGSGLSNSRPASMRSRPASIRSRHDPSVPLPMLTTPDDDEPNPVPSDSPAPATSVRAMAIDMPPPIPTRSSEAQSMAATFVADRSHSLSLSLDAATPPNSTFLSTLAETGPSYLRYHPPPEREPLSLAMAMASSSTSNSIPALPTGNSSGCRGSFGSEDETDGAREPEDVEMESEEAGDGDGVRRDTGKGKGKGKGKATVDESVSAAGAGKHVGREGADEAAGRSGEMEGVDSA